MGSVSRGNRDRATRPAARIIGWLVRAGDIRPRRTKPEVAERRCDAELTGAARRKRAWSCLEYIAVALRGPQIRKSESQNGY